MARSRFNPSDFGVTMERGEFMDLMVNEFNEAYGEALSVDELLLRPREAMRFCDRVRGRHGFYDVPDDIVLRSVLNRRKSPGG